jgi:hypothetical protein
MVVINDVMAYMFGFFLGRTPLIRLSPKKTWEVISSSDVEKKDLVLVFSRKVSDIYFSP